MAAQFTRFLLLLALIGTHTVLLFYQSLGHLQECLVNAEASLRARLQNFEVVSLFKRLNVVVGHLYLAILLVFIFTILSDVSLICQDDHVDVCAAMLLDFLEPPVHVLEGVFVS